MDDGLTVIEVVLTYIGTEPVLMIETAPSPDYDSYKKAVAWMGRVRTAKLARVIPLHPTNGGVELAQGETGSECLKEHCMLDRGHPGAHVKDSGEPFLLDPGDRDRKS